MDKPRGACFVDAPLLMPRVHRVSRSARLPQEKGGDKRPLSPTCLKGLDQKSRFTVTIHVRGRPGAPEMVRGLANCSYSDV